jgi:pyruvate formate lyase activating enzyme
MNPTKEALYSLCLRDGNVQCALCPRRCRIPAGGRGFCRNRVNRGGRLYTLYYGNPCTINMTSPERAPLYHFIPGHKRLALAETGCNLRCRYCQNWQISQVETENLDTEKSVYYGMPPEDAADLALKRRAESISFTYTEPVVSYEYVRDVLEAARKKRILTSIVSNGFINQRPLRELIKVLDAVNIDLKGFSDKFYRDISAGELEPVLKTLKTIRAEGVHLEIVNLVIPGLNDDPDLITRMCAWIRSNLGDDVPIHFTRFFPDYRMTDIQPTPVGTLETAMKIARDTDLKYVYIGNVPEHNADNTYCAECAGLLVRRSRFTVLENNVAGGRCSYCGNTIPGIWH